VYLQPPGKPDDDDLQRLADVLFSNDKGPFARLLGTP
jgi:hypothetical protein